MKLTRFWTVILAVSVLLPKTQAADTLDELGDLATQEAAEAVRALQADASTELLDVLAAMKGKSAVAKNWYLSVAQSVADRSPQQSLEELEQFLPRLSEDPAARYWAFSFVTRAKPEQREELLEAMLADPCLELRYEAVQLRLARLAEDKSTLSKEQQLATCRELLAAARLPEQVQEIARQLEELGDKVNLLEHFGFIDEWQVIGPFANLNQSKFDEVYPPEADYLKPGAKPTASYRGKNANVSWQAAKTERDDGAVDLNPIFANEKGAIVYAAASFESAGEQECEVRIGSPNAVKVWLNGELVISREVYHAGSQVDQYVAPVKLRAGANTLLVKVCQNEQTDSWAQEWEFQLRFTDSTGLAIRPAPSASK
jgi:hypothetical protein